MTVQVADDDAAAVFATLAILAGQLIAEAVPDTMFESLRDRLASIGVASSSDDQQRLGHTCDRLAGRLREAVEGRT